MKKYVFVNKTKVLAAGVFDKIGSLFIAEKKIEVQTDHITLLLLDHIGDVIFATPALSQIRELFPDSKITVIVGSWAKNIIENNPGVDQIIIFDASWFNRNKKTSHLKGIAELKDTLIGLKPDMAIDLRGDLRHNIAMYLARIPQRIGFGITGGGFLLTKEIDFPFNSHAVLRNLSIIKSFGMSTDHSEISTNIYLSEKDIAWSEQFMEAHNLKNRLLIGLHPEAGTQAKEWPIENFIRTKELLEGKLVEKAPIFLVTGTRQYNLSSHNLIELGGKLTLRQLAALQNKLDLFICGDTGPLHMAAALGCPTVAIYSGTNDLDIWGPWKGKVTTLKSDTDCGPCGRQTCSNKECLEKVTPQIVSGAALKMLACSK